MFFAVIWTSLMVISAVIVVTGSVNIYIPTGDANCVDASFLTKAILQNLTKKKTLLISYSTNPWRNILCRSTISKLHQEGTCAFVILRVEKEFFLPLRKFPPLDLAAIFLGEHGEQLEYEVWHHAEQMRPWLTESDRDFTTPMVAVIQGGNVSEVNTVFDELYAQKWISCVALQTDEGGVEFYNSPPLMEAGVRCGSRRSPAFLNNNSDVITSFLASYDASRTDAKLNGCVVVVKPLQRPPFVYGRKGKHGLDFLLMETLSDMLNFTLDLQPVSFSEFVHKFNGTWTGGLGLLSKGQVDVVMGGIPYTADRAKAFRASLSYCTDTLSVYTYRKIPVPLWQVPISVFKWRMWGLLAVSFIATGIITSSLLEGRMRSTTDVVLRLWGVLVESQDAPRVSSFRATTILFLWVVFSMHLTTSYRAALAGAISDPLSVRTPSNIYELKDVVTGFGMNQNIKQQLQTDPELNFLVERWVDCTDIDCIHYLQDDWEFALVSYGNSMKFFTPVFFLNSGGKAYIKALPKPLFSYHLSLFMEQGAPVRFAIDKGLSKIVTSGVQRYWERRLSDKISYHIWKAIGRNHDVVSLNMRTLRGHFATLAAGFVMAAITLAIELLGERPTSPKRDIGRRGPRTVFRLEFTL